MIKLILIELRKVFKKKSIFVMMGIMLLFNLINNILFYTDYDNDGNYKYLETTNIEEEKKILEEELLKYDYNDSEDISIIVDLKTKLDVIKLKEKYTVNTWQFNKIEDYLYNILEGINIYTYQVNDEKLLNEYKNKLNDSLDKFDTDDWKYFVNIDINNIEQEINELEGQIENINDEKERRELVELKGVKERELNILVYRLKNNVKEDNSYLNNALNDYQETREKIIYYENKINNLSFSEKREYQTLKEKLEISKYILEHQENYNKQNNLSYQLRTIVDDYEIFIIVVILIVASGIVAEEFTSGTIKLLLIKPYSRGKILLSKYFTVIIVMLLIILYLILLQMFVGGYIFGFSSLDLPVIVYDFNKESIVLYNVFIYMFIRILVKLPLLIMIITISFCLSTVVNNVVLSVVIPLFIYIFTPSISYLILQYKVNILKYLVNINWEFSNYLFGRIYEINGINFKFSLVIWLSYFILIMIFTYFNFKKKNIRNV